MRWPGGCMMRETCAPERRWWSTTAPASSWRSARLTFESSNTSPRCAAIVRRMQFQIKALAPQAVAALTALIALAPAARAETLAEALTAYRNNHVADAERMYSAIVADPSASPADRAGALTELARVDWLVRGETDATAGVLGNIADSPERCAAAVLVVRIFREAGAPATPLADAQASSGACTARDGEALHVQLARSHMALAAMSPQRRAAELAAAQTELDGVDPAASGIPMVGAARLS